MLEFRKGSRELPPRMLEIAAQSDVRSYRH